MFIIYTPGDILHEKLIYDMLPWIPMQTRAVFGRNFFSITLTSLMKSLIWYFIEANIINRTIHARLEIVVSLSVRGIEWSHLI